MWRALPIWESAPSQHSVINMFLADPDLCASGIADIPSCAVNLALTAAWFVCNQLFTIPLHAARRAMAAARWVVYMTKILDRRLLPAKVGSPARQHKITETLTKEKTKERNKGKEEGGRRRESKEKVNSQGGPGPPSTPSLSTSVAISLSLLPLRAWGTILPTHVSRRKVSIAGAARASSKSSLTSGGLGLSH